MGSSPTLFESERMVLKQAIDLTVENLVSIDGDILDHDEANQLFYRDGFRAEDGKTSMQQAFEFWKDQLDAPFIGDLIHWKWSGTNG